MECQYSKTKNVSTAANKITLIGMKITEVMIIGTTNGGNNGGEVNRNGTLLVTILDIPRVRYIETV